MKYLHSVDWVNVLLCTQCTGQVRRFTSVLFMRLCFFLLCAAAPWSRALWRTATCSSWQAWPRSPPLTQTACWENSAATCVSLTVFRLCYVRAVTSDSECFLSPQPWRSVPAGTCWSRVTRPGSSMTCWSVCISSWTRLTWAAPRSTSSPPWPTARWSSRRSSQNGTLLVICMI